MDVQQTEKKTTKYDGFFLNVVMYGMSMIVASLFPVVARTILSIIIHTPSLIETAGDASFLFNVIYPIVGVGTAAAFLAGGYFCCYFTARKIALKTSCREPKITMRRQLIVACALVIPLNVYFAVGGGFYGFFGMQFWYPAAIVAPWFGLVDKTHILDIATNMDISINNFIITGLTTKIWYLIAVFTAILSVAFFYFCLRGRRAGEVKGSAEYKKRSDELHASSPSHR